MTEQPPQTSTDDQEASAQEPEESRPALGDTVGTGTAIAFGCVAATLLLIVLALLFFVAAMIFG